LNLILHASQRGVLGRAPTTPIALEGALKLKEISYIHAEGPVHRDKPFTQALDKRVERLPGESGGSSTVWMRTDL
jgi:hypothetical protein